LIQGDSSADNNKMRIHRKKGAGKLPAALE